MKQRISAFVVVAVVFASTLVGAQNGSVKVAPEDKFAKLLPATVFLDGENVPTQKRNATLVDVGGKLAVFSLIDTAGYSSAYQEKYTGVILTQGLVKLGTKSLPAGAYGFGQTKVGEHDKGSVTIHVYDIGGNQVAEIPTQREAEMKGVRPLQVVVAADGSARLYLGPYYVAVAAK